MYNYILCPGWSSSVEDLLGRSLITKWQTLGLCSTVLYKERERFSWSPSSSNDTELSRVTVVQSEHLDCSMTIGQSTRTQLRLRLLRRREITVILRMVQVTIEDEDYHILDNMRW